MGGMVAREALFGATVALARQKVRSHLRVSFYEYNVDNLAINVIGLDRLSGVVPFS